ncbi:ATP-binding cassette domain-containing protein [Streptomyces sp. NPDC059637]|uniref:ATP-binding cassette domain-containing protein n=1 Tax=Streptomyces sp. NPDC059637 TaxID=3347752 RepID=UPI0036877A3D
MNPSPATPPAVRVENLTVRRRRAVLLDSLGLTVDRGVHGLLGPNGAGKTTLLRVLATVAAPSSGTVELLGRAPSSPSARTAVRRRLGYLPQQFGHYPRFTVRELVAHLAWLKEVPAARVPAAVERAVDRVGLADVLDRRMRTLSGGQVRRVGIAQAIVNDPELLVLDEPTAGLDPEHRVEFRALLRELGREAAVLVATHHVDDVAAACDRVTVLDRGRRVVECTPAELAAAAGTGTETGGDDHGGSPAERGYTGVLRRFRRDGAVVPAPSPSPADTGASGAAETEGASA